MNYSIDKQEKYTKIELQEEKLDATIAPDLKSAFVTLNSEGTKNFIVDLNKVKYVDSSGLGAILIANRLCRESKGTLVLVEVGEHVMKLIKISQSDKVLHILPTVQEGVDLILLNEVENELKEEQ